MNINQKAWAIYEKYVEGWGPISSEERAKVVALTLDEKLQYKTPNHENGNRNTATEDMIGFQQKFPGGSFAVRDVSAHHDVAILTWELIQANGVALMRGYDQIRLSTEGKILSITTYSPPVTNPAEVSQ